MTNHASRISDLVKRLKGLGKLKSRKVTVEVIDGETRVYISNARDDKAIASYLIQFGYKIGGQRWDKGRGYIEVTWW